MCFGYIVWICAWIGARMCAWNCACILNYVRLCLLKSVERVSVLCQYVCPLCQCQYVCQYVIVSVCVSIGTFGYLAVIMFMIKFFVWYLSDVCPNLSNIWVCVPSSVRSSSVLSPSGLFCLLCSLLLSCSLFLILAHLSYPFLIFSFLLSSLSSQGIWGKQDGAA